MSTAVVAGILRQKLIISTKGEAKKHEVGQIFMHLKRFLIS